MNKMDSVSENKTIKKRLCDIEIVETNDYSTRPNILKRANSILGKSKMNSEQTGKCQRVTSYL